MLTLALGTQFDLDADQKYFNVMVDDDETIVAEIKIVKKEFADMKWRTDGKIFMYSNEKNILCVNPDHAVDLLNKCILNDRFLDDIMNACEEMMDLYCANIHFKTIKI